MTKTILYLKISASSASDVGRVRTSNEDSCLVDTSRGLFLVSDGMGGHQAGATASQIVVRVLPLMIEQRLAEAGEPSAKGLRRILQDAISELSMKINTESCDKPGLKGMGATVVLALVRRRWAHIAFVGDSRAYLLREGELIQLTVDHTIVGMLLRTGQIAQEEASTHPARGQLSRFLGMGGETIPDLRTIGIKRADRLLLCSDGLTGMLLDGQIKEVLEAQPDPQEACLHLVESANQAGGKDNVTAVVVDFHGHACRNLP